jgi:hypothetical protein
VKDLKLKKDNGRLEFVRRQVVHRPRSQALYRIDPAAKEAVPALIAATKAKDRLFRESVLLALAAVLRGMARTESRTTALAMYNGPRVLFAEPSRNGQQLAAVA